ncbi:ABC transporter substrate-binding protein [Paenibacillus hemerocallicola]|uniref:ABC transporter substrate-binding protein n=1 Tax=Paenibacillus hemerocallicola TaxID=1172614 RepID=A0A5C4T7D2_9BACL|nr:ABC transporter substrate-binding protein [Paenibacillus hemerocallicola]TNJ64199.1 ABC transporter substrate-binding protein [Paenibacillus hemerocallicola]
MNKIVALLLVVLLSLSIAACGAGSTGDSTAKNGASPAAGQPAVKPADAANATATKYPLKMKDTTGTEITLQKAPQRIVSTSTAETEILFALGLGDRIVAVSDFDNYPEEAKTKTKVGGVSAPNVEAVLAANADLVITGISIKEDALGKLRSLNLPLYKFEPKSIDDIFANVLVLGQLTDKQKEAQELVDKMKKEIDRIKTAVSAVKPEQKKKVYIEFSPGYTVGKGEFMDEVLTLAGGINIAADTKGYNKINEEKIIQDNPAVIFYTTGTKDKAGQTLDQIIKSRNGWDKIEAVKNNQLVGVNQDTLNRPGPRIVEGLLTIAKGIYPDLVK